MTSPFHVVKHVIEGQHIRHYPGGSQDQDKPLKLCVKQYTPIDNPSPQSGDATIIVAHANGFIKELYEPLFEDLLLATAGTDMRIRNIWIADVAQQGASAVVNEQDLGNDSSYFDLSRDLLHMTNVFRDQMPRPIFGIGHSIGGTTLAYLSSIHPRLFKAICLIEPAIYATPNPQVRGLLALATMKQNFWGTRQELEAWVRENRICRAWDPRVVERLLANGVRETPSLLHPGKKGVAFTTSKDQEAFMIARWRNWITDDDGRAFSRETGQVVRPEAGIAINNTTPFYRPETSQTLALMPYLRLPILLVHGRKTVFISDEQRETLIKSTGTGIGGGGGVQCGQVITALVDGGHLCPFERVSKTAGIIAGYLVGQSKAWKAEEEKWKSGWESKSVVERQTVGEEWRNILSKAERPRKSAKPKL